MSKKILLVDDEETITDLMTKRLQNIGYEVESAANGPDGLNMARSIEPDLIVLDLMLPGIDGYKVCQMLKFDEYFREIPIILLSARDQESDKLMGFKTGANAYLSKTSVSWWEELQEKIKELI
ncbi:MAG: response regulator [bacterium]|nr:response regulator [bacterium]